MSVGRYEAERPGLEEIESKVTVKCYGCEGRCQISNFILFTLRIDRITA